MSLTFLSKSLNRTITFSDLDQLKPPEVRLLLGELHVAIASMSDSLAATQQRDAAAVDANWIHGVRKKHRICSAFMAQVQQLADALVQQSPYQTNYDRYLDKLLQEELGTAYADIKAEAKELALADLQAATPAA